MSMSHINALFAPRPAMPFQPPYHQQLGVKKMPAYTGIAAYLKEFESKEENDKNFETFKPIEQRKERRERIAEERTAMMKETLELKTANWNPQDYSFEADAYKTLFVGRLSFLTDEIKLKREFEQYGPVKSISFVEDKNTGKPRGYGFVEFEHERDMKMAYKHSDGRKIDGRRILVDVERGRTVKDWKPRKLGGGLGSSRKTKAKQTLAEKKAAARINARSSGSSRPSSSYPSGGGDRGGYASSRGGESRGGYGDSRSMDMGGSRGGDKGGDRGGYSGSSRSGGGDSRRSGEDYRGSSRGDDRRDGGGYSDYYRGGGGGGDRRDRY